jgi:hypothetical protein
MVKEKKATLSKKEIVKKPSGKADKNLKPVKAASKTSAVKKSETVKTGKAAGLKVKSGAVKPAGKKEKASSTPSAGKKTVSSGVKVPTKKEMVEGNRKLIAVSRPIAPVKGRAGRSAASSK